MTSKPIRFGRHWPDSPRKRASQRAGPILSGAAAAILLGALAFYPPEPCAPTNEQSSRLKAAARISVLAVERGRAEEELKRADAATKAARNQLQATLNALPDLLFEVAAGRSWPFGRSGRGRQAGCGESRIMPLRRYLDGHADAGAGWPGCDTTGPKNTRLRDDPHPGDDGGAERWFCG